MLRWVNLALAVLLVTLLVMELTRSREPAPAFPNISAATPVVVEEQPAPPVAPRRAAARHRGGAAPAAGTATRGWRGA